MKSIIITAFAPFGGEKINPTELILNNLPDEIEGFNIEKLLLPVEFTNCVEPLHELLTVLDPSAIIMLGQAGGRAAITPERIAINIMDAIIPDNSGYMPRDLPITEGGNEAYFSTLPLRDIESAITENGILCKISNTAGTYVCNCLMYSVMAAIRKSSRSILAGFIHVPYSDEQVLGIADRENTPHMSVKDMTCAIRIAIQVVVKTIRRNVN